MTIDSARVDNAEEAVRATINTRFGSMASHASLTLRQIITAALEADDAKVVKDFGEKWRQAGGKP